MGEYMVERSRTIDAPAARIWQELLDINSWPQWKPFIKSASWSGNVLEVGSKFKMNICVKGQLATSVKVKVTEIDEPRYVAWGGGIPWAAISVHSFKLEEKDGKTVVTSREDFTGALIFMMLWFLKEEDMVSLHDRWLDAIAKRVSQEK